MDLIIVWSGNLCKVLLELSSLRFKHEWCTIRTWLVTVTSSAIETNPTVKVTGDKVGNDDVFLHNFERNSSYDVTKKPGKGSRYMELS